MATQAVIILVKDAISQYKRGLLQNIIYYVYLSNIAQLYAVT